MIYHEKFSREYGEWINTRCGRKRLELCVLATICSDDYTDDLRAVRGERCGSKIDVHN